MKWTWGASPLHPKAAELISGVLPDNSYSRTRGLPFRRSQKQQRERVFDPPFSRFLKCLICLYNCVGSGWNNVSLWFFALHHEVLSPSRLWNLVLLYLVLPYSVDRRASIKCLDKLKLFWLVYNVCYNVSWTVVDFNFYPEKMHAPRQVSCAFCPCWELDGILISAIKTSNTSLNHFQDFQRNNSIGECTKINENCS